MKKIVLLVCSILLAVFLILDFRYGASSQVTFLGLKTMEPEELERLIKEEQAYEMEEKPELNLTFNGVSVPFEYEHSRYYLPLEAGNPEWENESLTSQFANENGELFFVADGDWLPDKQLSISNGTEYNLVYLSETGYSVYSIVFTAFPMITITTYDDVAEEEEPVTALEKLVEFQLYESGKLGQYSNYIQESAAYIRVRGNASQWLDKKSYKVTLLQRENLSENNQLNLLNIRTDDDWILYGIYAEDTKMRDKLAVEVWNDFGRFTQYGTSYGYSMEYVEIIINGEYWGLYGLMPRVDAKQLDLIYDEAGEEQDILYKTNTSVRPTVAELEQAGAERLLELGTVEIKYPKLFPEDVNLWTPLSDLLTAIESRDQETIMNMVDTDNLIDYWIYLQLLSAGDNTWKNQYLVAHDTEDGYQFTIVPWDLDYSWGLVWDGDMPMAKGYDYDPESILPMPIMDCLIWDNVADMREQVQERWFELRLSAISEENIGRILDGLENSLYHSGALQREMERWPDGLYAESTGHIRQYVQERLRFLDEYIAALTEEEF